MADEPIKDASPDPAQPTATPAHPAPMSAAPLTDVDTGYTASGVPTFDAVREKIETRYGTALGAAELDAATSEGRDIEEQYEERQRAAAERLAQIRASMRTRHDDSPAG